MKKIIKAQIANKFVLTTKCNAYHGMIKDAEDKATVSAVVWGCCVRERASCFRIFPQQFLDRQRKIRNKK